MDHEIRQGTFRNNGASPTEWYSSVDNMPGTDAARSADEDRWADWAQLDFWNISESKYALLQAVKRQENMECHGTLWEFYTKWAYPNERLAIDPKHRTPSFFVDFLRHAGHLPKDGYMLHMLRHYGHNDFSIKEEKGMIPGARAH